MTDTAPLPSAAQTAAIERFADAVYALLSERALSWGVVDISIEADGWYVDGELLFAAGPDMGFSVHTGAGEARFCVLVDERSERWTDDVCSGLAVIAARDDDELRPHVLAVLDGVLAARRPLLRPAAGDEGHDSP